eukprot:1159695-Pelagomonas_calceolata.AAC.9
MSIEHFTSGRSGHLWPLADDLLVIHTKLAYKRSSLNKRVVSLEEHGACPSEEQSGGAGGHR